MTTLEAHPDRRAHVLTLVASAARAGDDEALAEAIRCAPAGILSRWERALLSLIPTLNAANVLLIQVRVEVGVRDVEGFAEVLREVGWAKAMIAQAVNNVATLPAFSGWGTPDERDSVDGKATVAA